MLVGRDAVHHPEEERRHEDDPQRQTDVGVPQVERRKKSASHRQGSLVLGYHPEILCFGDIGGCQNICISSDTWYVDQRSACKLGDTPYAMKRAFKERTSAREASPLRPACLPPLF